MRFPRASVEERVLGGARKFGFVGLIASTTLSVSLDRWRSSRSPCGARLLLLVGSLVGAQAESVTWVWCGRPSG
eukprot:scaffold3_cov389-Prasinococcus_capsulatus_cf.AAC.27